MKFRHLKIWGVAKGKSNNNHKSEHQYFLT